MPNLALSYKNVGYCYVIYNYVTFFFCRLFGDFVEVNRVTGGCKKLS